MTVPLFPTLGIPELVIVLVLVMIFFGVGKLPQVGAALGKGIKAFKDGQRNLDAPDEIDVTPVDEVQED